MPTNGPVPWDIAPHTGAKHQIYATYLRDWFEILMRGGFRHATYAEGFAGPGVYRGGEPGSPVLAVKALVESEKLAEFTRQGRFLFVDDDKRCIARLQQELTREVNLQIHPETTAEDVRGSVHRARSVSPVRLILGKCADRLEQALDESGAWGQPIFANLDSWGNNPVPYHLLRRIAANKAGEVMVTLAPQHFIRFVETQRDNLDQVFGYVDSWRTVSDQDPSEKRRFLLTEYRKALFRAGFSFVLDFELTPTTGESLYLVFGTNNEKGHSVMKRALWAVDPNFGVAFRDPRDTMNELLFSVDEPQDGLLRKYLCRRLDHAGQRGEYVQRLCRWAELDTVYRDIHVIPALAKLLADGTVTGLEPPPLRRGSRVALTRHIAATA